MSAVLFCATVHLETEGRESTAYHQGSLSVAGVAFCQAFILHAKTMSVEIRAGY